MATLMVCEPAGAELWANRRHDGRPRHVVIVFRLSLNATASRNNLPKSGQVPGGPAAISTSVFRETLQNRCAGFGNEDALFRNGKGNANVSS
jgi:hypothetical protein